MHPRRRRPTTTTPVAVASPVHLADAYQFLFRWSVVSPMPRTARRADGLGQVGAHRLRHTAASEMLRAGAGLPEIGQVLGHRAAATTAIYAKVDRDGLRQIARPWPARSA